MEHDLTNGDILMLFYKKIDMLHEIRVYNLIYKYNITPLFTFYQDVNCIKYNLDGYKSIKKFINENVFDMQELLNNIFNFINRLQSLKFIHSDMSINTLYVKNVNNEYHFIISHLYNSHINDTSHTSFYNYYAIYKSLVNIAHDNAQLLNALKYFDIKSFYKNDFIDRLS